MKKLQQVSVLGLGLLGSSVTLAVARGEWGIRSVGYSHRAATRLKARQLGVAERIFDDLHESVSKADLVILATPICTFEDLFTQIAPHLKKGSIVTDVGSTKVMPHKWAKKALPKSVYYVGSHPIAGSEKRGVEFARDDLFYGAKCILTKDASTNANAYAVVKKFWQTLGSQIEEMSPAVHDRILGNVSHVPHVTAAALINASNEEQLKHCGKGFVDTSRIASGPANVWADIFFANADNTAKGIDKVICELEKMKKAVLSGDKNKIEIQLEKARYRRAKLIEYKMQRKEIL